MDPLGRPTFLYLTDTWRKKTVVEREFLDWRRDKPVFAPSVRVLSELFDDLWLRHGDGRAVLPPRVVALVADRLLRDRRGASPWLTALGEGPLLGQALADLFALTREARDDRLQGAPHAEELRSLLSELAERLQHLRGFTTRPASLEALLSLLEQPPVGLVQWLRATHSVVIDDVLQLSPLRQAVLVALCRAWEAAGTHVVVAFETGRDLGGREVESFFEYGDIDPVALPLKPFAATRALRRTLFEQLVGQGSGAILLAGRDSVQQVEPWSEPGAVEAPDLSDLVYLSGPVPLQSEAQARALLGQPVQRVQFLRCDDPASELRIIARQVKQALLQGIDPGACVVALPDLATYAPSVRAVFDDHGIPHALAAGSRLAHSPVCNAVRQVLSLARDGFPTTTLLALLRSDLVRCPDGVDPEWLRKACLGAGVREGRPLAWQPALVAWVHRTTTSRHDPVDLVALHQGLQQLESLCDVLQAVATDASPEQWRVALWRVLDVLALPERVGRGYDARANSDNLHAWGTLVGVLDELVRDCSVVDRSTWSAADLCQAFDRALHQATYQPDPPGHGRVQVVGALELRGLTPRRLWLGGLHRRAFPAPRSTPFLVPPAVERALQPVDALAEARYLLGSLLRNTLDDAGGQAIERLVISWPCTLEGQPAAPSPVLADLLDRPVECAAVLLGEWLVDSPHSDGQPYSRSDLLRIAAHDARWAGLLSAEDAQQAQRQQQAHEARQQPAPGPWEGVLGRGYPVKQPLGVTRLERYLQCPARYGYEQILALEEVRPWEPEVDALRSGSAIHAILDGFMKSLGHTPLEGAQDREGLALRLHEVASKVLDWLESQGGAEQALIAEQRRRWLAGLVDDAPAGLLRAWLDHEIDEPLGLIPVDTEVKVGPIQVGPLSLHGQIDRIDRLRTGGLLVSDYKTGTPPPVKRIERGLLLQPLVYAHAVARMNPGHAVGATYYQVKRPDLLGRKSWSGDEAVVAAAGARARPLVLDEAGRQRLLDHAAEGGRRLLQGVFHTTLADPEEAGCDWCSFRRICRYHADRAADLLEGAADLQRPLEAR